MDVVALVVAGGVGRRLGHELPKALVPCARRPLLSWSLDALSEVPEIKEVVVALPAGTDTVGLLPQGVVGVTGGSERSHSVRAALDAVRSEAELVLVHDAARPLVTPSEVVRVIAAVARGEADGATAASPVTDTIKVVVPGTVTVARTLDRGALWAVQTPQVFKRAALEAALDQPDAVLAAATDDASLVEGSGGKVVVVETSPENRKVTTRLDLQLAERALLERGSS